MPARGFDVTNSLLSQAALGLHKALRSAIDQCCPHISGARACGRTLGLRRNLGWQVYTIAYTSDHVSIIRALPKSRGWALVFKAMAERGCAAGKIDAVRAAIKTLDSRLSTTRETRPVVRAAAAGALDTASEREIMLRSRADATRANAYLHGIRVEACLSAFLIGPADAKGVVDLATATLIRGVRRSRPGIAWPLYYTFEAHDEHQPARGVIAPKYRSKGIVPLVADHSTPGVAEKWLRMRKDGPTQVVELLDHAAAGCQPLDLAFVECLKAAGTAKPSKKESRLLFLMNTPTERAVVEVWVHESVTLTNVPSGQMVSSPNLERRVLAAYGMERLPLEASAVAIESPGLPADLREHQEQYRSVLERAADRLGAPLSEFRGYQLDVPDPPWMSMLVMTFDC